MQCVEIFLENMNDFKAYEKAVDESITKYMERCLIFCTSKNSQRFQFLQVTARLFGNI